MRILHATAVERLMLGNTCAPLMYNTMGTREPCLWDRHICNVTETYAIKCYTLATFLSQVVHWAGGCFLSTMPPNMPACLIRRWCGATQRACCPAAAVMSTAVAALLPSVESLMSAEG